MADFVPQKLNILGPYRLCQRRQHEFPMISEPNPPTSYVFELFFIFIYLFQSGKLMPCSCCFNWCETIRKKHIFGNSVVTFPTDDNESVIWSKLIGLQGKTLFLMLRYHWDITCQCSETIHRFATREKRCDDMLLLSW